MFRNGTTLPGSPKKSKYKETDMLSCHAVRSTPGLGGTGVPSDDYEYYNEIAYKKRMRDRYSSGGEKVNCVTLVLCLPIVLITMIVK